MQKKERTSPSCLSSACGRTGKRWLTAQRGCAKSERSGGGHGGEGMIRRRIGLVASLIAVLLAAGKAGLAAGGRADNAAVRKQLEGIYQEYNQAFKAKDTSLLQKWIE